MRQAAAMEVTVVIPTRDRPQHLRTALWSVAQQQGGAPTVVVVDDGSAVPVVVPADGEQRVQVVRNASSEGVSRARNRGLAQVTTDWVAFLDDDDVWLPGHLAQVTAAIAAADRDGVDVGLGYAPVVVCGAARDLRNVIGAHPPEVLARALHGGNVLPTPSCVVVRADLVRAAGGFDATLTVSADWDLWLGVARQVPGAAAGTAPSVLYTQHDANMHHGAQVTLAELAEMQRRYGALAAQQGVAMPDASFPAYLAGTLKTSGQRRAAAAWYLRSLRARRRPSDLARAGAALLGVRPPAAVRRRPQLDGEAAEWLARLRAFEAGGSA
jgi:glycosyltransferase involved in cell wall biosynthesis